uniref:Papain-like cysteine peptidase n=1 Tax=viral metagenome TaxID=1070528 RepID=A0A6C0D5Q3_9ZZZZ
MTIEIKFVFSIGHSCNAGGFLKENGLRKVSSPFDWMLIDFETSLEVINDNFEHYLNDTVHFKQDTNILELVRSKKHNIIPKNVNTLYSIPSKYMNFNWYDHNMFINANYLDNNELPHNFYDWSKYCIFIHHDLLNQYFIDTLQNRINRFKYLYNNFSENTLLFYLTKIEHINTVEETMENILNMLKENNIKSYIGIIVCCDNVNDCYYFKDKCLFIFKKVATYNEQLAMGGTENTINISFTNELEIIKNHFTFNLIEYTDIENNW